MSETKRFHYILRLPRGSVVEIKKGRKVRQPHQTAIAPKKQRTLDVFAKYGRSPLLCASGVYLPYINTMVSFHKGTQCIVCL